MTAPVASADLAPLLEHCFLFDAFEDSYEISGIAGQVPDWLRGSYYANGPARFERAGYRYKHWLDGDGMVCALHFTGDGVRFVSRFVQTRKLKDENAAGVFLYRGFGTAFAGDRLRRNMMLEPPLNVSVCRWGGRVLAFGEQCLPVALDPLTLETAGEYDFHEKLNEVSPFAAHAKIDPSNGNLLNFGISFSPKQPTLNVYDFSADGNQFRRRRYPLELQCSNHDFGFTSRHVVFYLSPLLMNFERFWNDRVSVMESLSWQPEKGSRLFIAPRQPEYGEPFALAVGHGYCLHWINCYEEGRRLTADVLEFELPVYQEYQPIPDLFATVARCSPVRYIIDLERRTLLDRYAMDYDRACDFPAINPSLLSRKYNDFWALGISRCGIRGRKFFDQLAHGSWRQGAVSETYQAPAGEYFSGEPAFVDNPKLPEQAVLIVQHLNTRTDEASFQIFDAFAIERGPIARVPLQHKLHPLFHAGFYAVSPTGP